MKKAITLYALSLFSFMLVMQVSAQVAGTYDPTFANNGELSDLEIYPLNQNKFPDFVYTSMALAPGNEFVISRISNNAFTVDTLTSDTLTAIRYLQSGARDVTFGLGSSGLSPIVLPSSWSDASVLSSAIQSDRKTLIAGRTSTGASGKGFLLRLNDDGSVDNSFGSNGFVYQSYYPSVGEQVWQVTIQPDGNILVLDGTLNTDSTDTLSLLRYTPSGTLDNTFNSTGIYKVPFYRFLPTGPFFFKVDLNNLITFAAYSNYADSDNLYLFQLNPNGTPNVNYGQGVQEVSGGSLITTPQLINGGNNLGFNFQADDKLILTQSTVVDSVQWIISRFNTDGTPDVDFGDSGVVVMQGADGGVPFDIHSIQPTPFSQIVVAGLVSLGGAIRIDIARLNANGSIDGAFGAYQGHTILNSNELDDIVWNLIIQPDEKILINGLVTEKPYNPDIPNGYSLYEVVRLIGSGTGSSGTAVNDVENRVEMKIYPNPTGNSLCVSAPGVNEGNIELADMEGRMVITQTVSGNSPQYLNLGDLASGVYLLTFKSNELVLTNKVIKQ